MPPKPTAEYAIRETIYSTINHNLPVMVYVAGAVFILVLLLVKPNRKLVFFLLAFILLAFQFEYVKHIADPLQEQTRVSIESTGYESVKGRQLMTLVFQYIIPFGSYLAAWGLMLIGIMVSTVPIRRKKSGHEEPMQP